MRKSPDITESPLGRDVVDVLAFGCIQYMLEHGMPLTGTGYEQLVTHSRETGLNGRIAFQVYDWTQERLQALFAGRRGLPATGGEGVAERLRSKPSVRNRLLAMGLGGDDGSLGENEKRERLERMKEFLGPEVGAILEALRHGECQRELVWARIARAVAEGDVEKQLAAFRKGGAGE